MESADMAQLAAHAAGEKKAKEVRILDIRSISAVADYFVICSGTSNTHIRAIADSVEELLTTKGLRLHHMEGYQNGRWILLDFGDLVVHVMQDDERSFYNLERLWGDAVEVDAKIPAAG
ncbi:MAG: ribosome silencing factor [Bacillota bacterium]